MRIPRRAAAVLLAFYVAFVLLATLTPLPLEVPPPNPVPFATIVWLIATRHPLYAAAQIAGNLLLMAPIGFLAPQALIWLNRWWRIGLAVAVLAAAIELAQSAIPGRHADIDDAILNLTGALVAYWVRPRLLRLATDGRPGTCLKK